MTSEILCNGTQCFLNSKPGVPDATSSTMSKPEFDEHTKSNKREITLAVGKHRTNTVNANGAFYAKPNTLMP